jgi:serine protease Do
MRRFMTFGPALVVLVTAVATLVLVPEMIRRVGYASTDVQVHLARAGLADDDLLERINAATRSIAKAVEPTVVHVAISMPGPRPNLRRAAAGSGWIYDKEGHIVTNAHVVRGITEPGELTVQFFDGRAVPAEIVGVDPQTDIAVIQVASRDGLFPAARATGDSIEQGDRVYAFGSPFGFKFSMSEGIVSGLGRDPREIIGEQGYTNFIQTDAAVNPGNSGGPLVDVKGRVVGMNVAIATAASPRGGGSQGGEGQNSGISFAIPLDTIEAVVPSLIANGAVQRGYLGVTLPPDEEVNVAMKQRLGFDREGVVVPNVAKGGPAEKAGLAQGDVILAINGVATPNIGVLRQRITVNRPGDHATVRVWRQGKIDDHTVTLGDLSKTDVAWQNVVDALARDYGLILLRDEEHAIVGRVVPNSPAARDGFRPEQTIVSVEGKTFDTPFAFLVELYDRGVLNGRKIPVEVVETNGTRRSLELQITP